MKLLMCLTIVLATITTPASSHPTTDLDFTSILSSCSDKCEGVWKGIEYKIYSQSSVTFKTSDETWSVECDVDDIDDRATCILSTLAPPYYMETKRPRLRVVWSSDFLTPIVGMAHNPKEFPRATRSIRVDKNPPFTSVGTFPAKAGLAILSNSERVRASL
jgi:hypothetical protein